MALIAKAKRYTLLVFEAIMFVVILTSCMAIPGILYEVLQ
jgi:hypothetical protein